MQPFYFDTLILHFINQFAGKLPWFDHFVYMISENNLVKGGVLFTLCWFIWWRGTVDDQKVTRQKLLVSITCVFFAEITTILLSLTLPHRTRPYFNTELDFTAPIKLGSWWNESISSFPSDHGTMFMALTMGIWRADKPIGWFAICYTFLFVFMPRIYLGFHYPSDIIAGALIGVLFVYIGAKLTITNRFATKLYIFCDEKPYYFYPVFILVIYQLTTLFTETRSIVSFLKHPMG